MLGDRVAVILKTISAPAIEQFDELMADARRAARKAGLRRSDITAAVEQVRDKA